MDIPAPDAMLVDFPAGTGCDLALSASSCWDGRLVAVVEGDDGVDEDTFTCSAGGAGGGGEVDICNTTLDALLPFLVTLNASEVGVDVVSRNAARAMDRKEERMTAIFQFSCFTCNVSKAL